MINSKSSSNTLPTMFNNVSEKFNSLAESLIIAEEECKKFRQCTIPSNTIKPSDLRPQINTNKDKIQLQKCRNKLSRFRGKDSIFKRPDNPVRPVIRRDTVPDYHKNPHKWTKYSLADVSNEDMSDRSNSQAAFSFLKELRARKRIDDDLFEQKESIVEINKICEPVLFKSKTATTSSIQFRKPQKNKNIDAAIISHVHHPVYNDKPMFQNSKIIMPEYVIGQKERKKSSKRVKSVTVKEVVDKGKNVKLCHLEEVNEEEEEEE